MALPPIIPPNPIEANVDYRYDGCYQSMVLVMLQRLIDSSDDTALIAKIQEVINELTTLNGKVATEVTLALIEAITSQMNFTGGALDVNATISTAGLSTELKQDDQITLATASNVLLTSINNKDFATQTTLEAIRVLLVGGSDYADNSTSSNVSLTDVSTAVLSANVNRKEVIYYNDSKEDIYLFFGTPAVFGTGILLFGKQQYISDKYRGIVTAIMDTGKTGTLKVTDVFL